MSSTLQLTSQYPQNHGEAKITGFVPEQSMDPPGCNASNVLPQSPQTVSSSDVGNRTAVLEPSHAVLQVLPTSLTERSWRPSPVSRVETFTLENSLYPDMRKELDDRALPDTVVVGGTASYSLVRLPTLHFSESDRTDVKVAATHRKNSRIQFAALCWCLFLEG